MRENNSNTIMTMTTMCVTVLQVFLLAGCQKSYVSSRRAHAVSQVGDIVSKSGHCDDLSWLVGKWWCVEKAWLNRQDRLEGSSNAEHLLEWFNVYFPYADEQLTLRLTDVPEDRCIAAEFIIRGDPDNEYGKKGLASLRPRGKVCLSTNTIAVGYPFNRFEMRYALVKQGTHVQLVMESKHMRLIFEKITADPGDIKKSRVVAPIVDYSVTEIDELRRRYNALVQIQK